MTLRTDGFVSVHADYEGGELLTRLLTFEGSNLVLNFATSAAGSIRLELQDAHGQPLPGFAMEESPGYCQVNRFEDLLSVLDTP